MKCSGVYLLRANAWSLAALSYRPVAEGRLSAVLCTLIWGSCFSGDSSLLPGALHSRAVLAILYQESWTGKTQWAQTPALHTQPYPMASGLVLIVGFGLSILEVFAYSAGNFLIWTLVVTHTGRGGKTKGLLHLLADCSCISLALGHGRPRKANGAALCPGRGHRATNSTSCNGGA